MDIQQIRNFAQSLGSTERALFAHELRKLAGEIDGVASKGQVRGKTQEAIANLNMSMSAQKAALAKLKKLSKMLDE